MAHLEGMEVFLKVKRIQRNKSSMIAIHGPENIKFKKLKRTEGSAALKMRKNVERTFHES